MIEIIVYGKDACPQCVTAKTLMDRINNEGITAVYKKLDTDFTLEELLEKFPDVRSFPVISVKMSPESVEEVIPFAHFQSTVDNLL